MFKGMIGFIESSDKIRKKSIVLRAMIGREYGVFFVKVM